MARGGVVIRGASATAYELTATGTAGQVLTSNGAGADPTFQAAAGGGGDITMQDKVVGTVDVVNTTTETAIYSYAVPGGTIGTGNILRLTLNGTFRNFSGSNRSYTLRTKYGATTLHADVSTVFGSLDVRHSIIIELWLYNVNGNTSSQRIFGRHRVVGGTATTGDGDLALTTTLEWGLGGTAAEDSTASNTLSLTIEHPAASSDLSFSREAVTLEKL